MNTDVILVALFLISITLSLIIAFVVGVWIQRQRDSLSPYTGTPLRRGETLTFYSKEQILRFIYEHHSYDNRMYSLNKSSFCRDTGRIFSNSITWYDTIKVDWSFLQKRRPGNYVSWGSLTEEQQNTLIKLHGSLKGFQVNFSSKRPSPRDVEPEFALAKPGPLYVDVNTNTLMGWKSVPGTDFEVLIVQKPLQMVLPDEINKSI